MGAAQEKFWSAFVTVCASAFAALKPSRGGLAVPRGQGRRDAAAD
jgi:hypothetical protein